VAFFSKSVISERIISDFALTGEFRLLSSATERQTGIRTINTDREWPARGYRLRLASTAPVTLAANGYALIHKDAADVRLTGAEWHTLSIAVRLWKFEPALLNGSRISTVMEVQVFFKLQ
jgi:hypothetical protein